MPGCSPALRQAAESRELEDVPYIALCDSAQIKRGGRGFRFVIERDRLTLPAFVIRHELGVSAFINRCKHRDLELDWTLGDFFDPEGDQLICATHGARYDPVDGVCLAGPCAGEALTSLDVVEIGDVVYLSDTRWRLNVHRAV